MDEEWLAKDKEKSQRGRKETGTCGIMEAKGKEARRGSGQLCRMILSCGVMWRYEEYIRLSDMEIVSDFNKNCSHGMIKTGIRGFVGGTGTKELERKTIVNWGQKFVVFLLSYQPLSNCFFLGFPQSHSEIAQFWYWLSIWEKLSS